MNRKSCATHVCLPAMKCRIPKVCLVLLVLVALLSGCASLPSGADEAMLVDRVDLQRYAGLWYQVARYPNWFQRGICAESTARYTLQDDGSIEVFNQCWKDQFGGTATQSVKARAVPYDSSGNHLRVRFYNLFTASYLVVALDPEYRWAAVATPGRRELWVLSREPALEESMYQEVLALLATKGFDLSKIRRTSQQ